MVREHGPVHRVVIVGAGFGGLKAARTLAGRPVDVTIVDQHNFHTFQPLLYEVATAGLESDDVAYPVRAIFGRTGNIRFRLGTVTGVDWDTGQVQMASGDALSFDSLIVASGATARFFGIPGAAEHSLPLYTLADARRLRDHVLRRFETADRDAATIEEGELTFVVVGGGPTGVEVSGALAELLDVAVGHDGFRFDRRAARIVLVDGLDRLLTPFKGSAADYAARTLSGREVELHLGHMVKTITDSCVELEDGEKIPTRTVVWAGGVSVEGTVADRLGSPTAKAGRLVVRADLSLPDHENAFGVGDAAAVPWGPGADAEQTCPQLAQVAIQSGRHAARQILLRTRGQPTEPFRYKDKGIMATIGRRAAITQFPRGLIVRGTLGWLAWLGLHLVYLIGFRNRLVVLVNWSWRYLSWGSGPRVIIDDLDADDEQPDDDRPEGGRPDDRHNGGNGGTAARS
jgi:NADH:ubiquinone reductase (H+-translocating)